MLKEEIINIFHKLSKVLLFIICLSFVIIRGFECFQKYFKKPESVEMSYHHTKDLGFPSFTICPEWDNYLNKNKLPKSYDENVLKSCNLALSDYQKFGPWHSSKCENPEELYYSLGLFHVHFVNKTTYIHIDSTKINRPGYNIRMY